MLDDPVQVDAKLLPAVLLANLIDNSVKFSPSGEAGYVEVGHCRKDGDACLYVDDNGIGIDAQRAESLFAPFSRLHDGTYEGYGIGLSIVRRAVARLGGKVWAEARTGPGSRFAFTLPAAV